MLRRIIARAVSGDAHGQTRAPPQTPSGLANSRPMEHTTHSAKSAPARDESADEQDRPQLVAHDVSDAHGGPLVAFYDPNGRTLDGEIIYCEHPAEVRP